MEERPALQEDPSVSPQLGRDAERIADAGGAVHGEARGKHNLPTAAWIPT